MSKKHWKPVQGRVDTAEAVVMHGGAYVEIPDIACTLPGHLRVCELVDVEDDATAFDLESHIARQIEFSQKTFGPGPRTAGVVDHIRKELAEIEADPGDIYEWIDVIILGFDGAWRAGFTPSQIIEAIVAKQTKNEQRDWPDWRTVSTDKAIEHVRQMQRGGE